MHCIDLPEHIAAKLSELPISARTGRLERAINRALDAAGWPKTAPDATGDHWYVIVWERTGILRGHVGPIVGKAKADAAARSWSSCGRAGTLSRSAVGPRLTNPLGTGY